MRYYFILFYLSMQRIMNGKDSAGNNFLCLLEKSTVRLVCLILCSVLQKQFSNLQRVIFLECVMFLSHVDGRYVLGYIPYCRDQTRSRLSILFS